MTPATIRNTLSDMEVGGGVATFVAHCKYLVSGYILVAYANQIMTLNFSTTKQL